MKLLRLAFTLTFLCIIPARPIRAADDPLHTVTVDQWRVVFQEAKLLSSGEPTRRLLRFSGEFLQATRPKVGDELPDPKKNAFAAMQEIGRRTKNSMVGNLLALYACAVIRDPSQVERQEIDYRRRESSQGAFWLYIFAPKEAVELSWRNLLEVASTHHGLPKDVLLPSKEELQKVTLPETEKKTP